MTADTTPEAVAERVEHYRALLFGTAASAQTAALAQACDLIEALATDARKSRRELEIRRAQDRRLPLCSDCRDKQPEGRACLSCEVQRVTRERDTAIARAERAEAALAARTAAEYPAAFAADAAARARLAADRAAIPMTERDRRGVDLGVGRDL